MARVSDICVCGSPVAIRSRGLCARCYGVAYRRDPSQFARQCWTVRDSDGFHRCSSCREFKPPSEFRPALTASRGTKHACKPCERAIRKAKGWDVVRDATKRRARNLVQVHVKRGKIQKPRCCESCGREALLQGHHDDYSKPLDVRWVCEPDSRNF